MNNIDLTPIFRALVLLIAALITYRLIPWIKAKTTNEQQKGIRALVRTLVYAAEQLFGAGNGPQKLEYVKMKLAAAGYDVNIDEIEAAVKEAFNCPAAILELPDAQDGKTLEETLPPLEKWPLDMLESFCELNGFPCEDCETRDDYINAILNARKPEAVTAEAVDEEPAEEEPAQEIVSHAQEPPDLEPPVID